MPGAAITGQIDPATYAGTITVKVGPIATSYRGKMHFERLDAPSGTAQIVASGQDVRGKGGAQMRMTSHVSEGTPGQTEVSVESDVAITGLLAQMGRGMIEDVSNQMFERFSAAMQAELESAPTAGEGVDPAPGGTAEGTISGDETRTPVDEPAATGAASPDRASVASPAAATTAGAPPIEVVSFGSQLVARALGRTARRPSVWVAAILLAVVLYWVWMR